MTRAAPATFCISARRIGGSGAAHYTAKQAGVFQAGANMLRTALPRFGAATGRFFENQFARFGSRAGAVARDAGGAAQNIPRINFADLKPATNAAQQAGRTAAGATQQAARTAVGAAPKPPGPPAQNTFGHVAWNAVRGGLGFGPQENATRLARGASHVAAATTIGAPLAAGALGSGGQGNNPYQQQLGMQVTASERGPAVYTVKTALDPDKVRAGVDLASYGALAVPLVTKLVAPKFYEQHHGLMHGLDAAGLAGLTGTGIYGIATGKRRDRVNDALDVAGLGLMGLGLHRRMTEH